MKISLITVGPARAAEVSEAIVDYEKRLGHYTDFESVQTSEEKLPKLLDAYDRVFLLDETGASYTSKSFASFMEKQLNAGLQRIAFVIGGAFGFSPAARERADSLISLSSLTFPHRLVPLIFLEQLYRAFTIIRNEKYHHS